MIKFNASDVIVKSAGALALMSVATESNKIAISQAIEDSKVVEAKMAVRNGIGCGKLNYESPKYNDVKETLYDHYPYAIKSAWHGFKGYLTGFSKGLINNTATAGFAVLAVASKHKPFKLLSMTGLAASIGWNFIKNGTNVLERTDYLE